MTHRTPSNGLVSALAALALAATASAQPPPIVQPGAPGEPSRVISVDEASDLAGIQYNQADVNFMQGMISHHAQALEMTALLETRTERELMQQLAKRIELSQEDEIRMMQQWLRSRGETVTEVDAHHAHGAHLMPGMLTPEEMERLGQARGHDFDRLFLELMIKHHRGALIMVEDLLSKEGTAQDSQLYAFTTDIVADQSMEIERMDAMLRNLSPDPRVDLSPGFDDAGQAISNLELVASLPKPPGFFDPFAPAGRPMPPERKPGQEAEKEKEKENENEKADDASDASDAEAEAEPDKAPPRPGILNFANTDLAFKQHLLIEGNYHGFNSYDVEDPTSPALLASVVCPGGQGDVSIYQNLLFVSVEQTRGRVDCGLQGVAEPASPERFRGVRIYDISDIRMPRQVAAVQTCRGSHTHTLVSDPDDDGNIWIYGSGTASVRPTEEMDECTDAPADPNMSRFSIDVIQVPLDHPEKARVVSRPRIFADPESGKIAGLWAGGDHGPGTQETSETDQCHDITAFPEIGLAAGACSGNGILLDISDPAKPVRIDEVVDPTFAYWHSATFNNDGTKVIFTDEWGGGGRPRCRASDPRHWGADAIFDIVDRELVFRGYYKLPAPQTEQENCVAHNGSLIPVPGRDIMVQAWYQGGISVFDFTDSTQASEIAFFDRGPLDAKNLILGGYWSAYWYDGAIYGTEIARGLDVLKLLPSEYLTPNEIAAAALYSPERFNAQQQRRVVWPARPVVARAYLDQLERGRSIAPERIQALRQSLDRADAALAADDPHDAAAADRLDALASDVQGSVAAAAGRDQARLRSLAETLEGIAVSLRAGGSEVARTAAAAGR